MVISIDSDIAIDSAFAICPVVAIGFVVAIHSEDAIRLIVVIDSFVAIGYVDQTRRQHRFPYCYNYLAFGLSEKLLSRISYLGYNWV